MVVRPMARLLPSPFARLRLHATRRARDLRRVGPQPWRRRKRAQPVPYTIRPSPAGCLPTGIGGEGPPGRGDLSGKVPLDGATPRGRSPWTGRAAGGERSRIPTGRRPSVGPRLAVGSPDIPTTTVRGQHEGRGGHRRRTVQEAVAVQVGHVIQCLHDARRARVTWPSVRRGRSGWRCQTPPRNPSAVTLLPRRLVALVWKSLRCSRSAKRRWPKGRASASSARAWTSPGARCATRWVACGAWTWPPRWRRSTPRPRGRLQLMRIVLAAHFVMTLLGCCGVALVKSFGYGSFPRPKSSGNLTKVATERTRKDATPRFVRGNRSLQM